MASIFLLWRVDQFLVNDKTSTQQLGLYITAVTVAEMAQVLTGALTQVMLPKQAQGSLVDATAFSAVVVRVNLLFSCVVALGLAVVSPFAIRLVYGSEYTGAIVPLLALLPGIVGASVLGPCQTVLVRLNKPSRVAVIYFSMLALNIGLNLLLIPSLGITGASLSSTIAYVILSALMIRWISRATKHPVREFVPGMADMRTLVGILPGNRARAFREG
jgi:stage V sporulation protein B